MNRQIKQQQLEIPKDIAGIIDIGEDVIAYDSGFKSDVDAFAFPNIGTYISAGGNCAGLSHIMAQKFAGNILPASANSTFDDVTFSYSINTKEYPGLFDTNDIYKVYEPRYFIDSVGNDNLLDRDKLNEKDRNFVDFVGYYQAKMNSIKEKRISSYNFTEEWSDIQELIDYFRDNPNEVVLCGLSKYKMGHCILITGIAQDSNNPDTYYLSVYDTNYPYRMVESIGKENFELKIRITKILEKDIINGKLKEKATYYYKPYKDGSTIYSSEWDWDGGILGTLTQQHGIAFRDKDGIAIK